MKLESGHVDLIRHQVHVPVRQTQADFHARLQDVEFRDQRREDPAAEAQRRSDPELAGRRAGHHGHAGFGAFDRLQNTDRVVVENVAGLGWLEAARRAIEKPDADLFLQLEDAVAGGCGRQAKAARRR
jgi:hypothetical protein